MRACSSNSRAQPSWSLSDLNPVITRRAHRNSDGAGSDNFRTFETYLVVTFMYLAMVFAFRGVLAAGFVLLRGQAPR